MDTRGEINQSGENPYVGPRPFERDEKDKFFGREREARDLLSLVVSERLVLFYAQSGAGKTSLINARLIPGLEAKDFEVLPVSRVSGELPPGVEADNIFVMNLMFDLDMGEHDPQRYQGVRLSKFLVRLEKDGDRFYYRSSSGQNSATEPDERSGADTAVMVSGYSIMPRVLIIDQFEELFTTHHEAWEKREDFLRQLAEAMEKDPYLWVVLAMREDHIAELDSYLSIFPDGLRVRYYMQRLTIDAAMDAVTQPVAKRREFETEAASELVKNLSQISTGYEDEQKPHFVPGEFVEPVQLQVVCYQLWEDLKNLPGDKITLQDIKRLAGGQDLATFIDQSLADFYEDNVRKVLRQFEGRLSEKSLREMFSNQLITEARTRGFVFMGEFTTGHIPNTVVLELEGQLLRGEDRAGGKWYELVHDRFIDPILHSNQKWFAHQTRTRVIAGVFWLILFLVLLGNLALVNNTRADDYKEAVQTSQSDKNIAFQEKAEATGTLVALELAARARELELVSTVQAVEALLILQQTRDLASSTATNQPVIDTPQPSPTSVELDTSPTINLLATSQAKTAEALKLQLDGIKATQTAMASPVRELIIGYTPRQSQIRVIQLGYGTRNIVLVGGLHAGFAPATVTLAEDLADYYSDHLDEIPADLKLHIILNANPDSPEAPGELPGRLNSNDVDLNRNWDCDWTQTAKWGGANVSGGSEPFSELETQALREYFIRNQPVGVVFFEARASGGMVAPGGCGLESIFSESLAQLYGQAAKYRVALFEAYAVNGDATNWLDKQGIPAVSVLLPDYNETDWSTNLEAVQVLLESYR